jgi:hypothetical protein
MAKISLNFQNYHPIDDSLGHPARLSIIQPESYEAETGLRMEKFTRAFYSDHSQPLKVIPQKSTLDLEKKLLPRKERLKLRTEMAIVELLREKLLGEVPSKENGKEEEAVINGNSMNFEERAEIERVRRLQAVEENPKIKETRMFEEVLWVDELEGEKPINYKGDLVNGIAMMEKLVGRV